MVYLAEFAAVPRMMTDMSSRMEAAAHGTPTCCHKAMEGQAIKGRAMEGQKKGQCPKPSKGCSQTADCCINCPLCYLILLPVSTERVGIAVAPREYGVWTSSYVYLYHASSWKPPNVA